MKQGQFPAVFNLTDLNGENGFKIDGENPGDVSGGSDSLIAGGDINGDGYADILIGAYRHNSQTGRSYVIWGGKLAGNSGLISLSNLNNTVGVKIDGEMSGDYSGSSLSYLGDINQDGYDDFIIGANQHGNYAGRSYVIYGGSQIGNNGLLGLSGLNGTNGFKIDGEANSIYSGTCVSAAGDINGDHLPDMLIGEPYYNAQNGRAFVLYSGNGVGSSGDVLLSGVSTATGLKMDGQGGDGGYWVNTLGDVNHDGHVDLSVGAYAYNIAGRSYVVFGGPSLNASGEISLGNLNGNNGFFLSGENANDGFGTSSAGLGDINGDGISDMIIAAPGYNSGAGRSYVLLGSSILGNGLSLSSLNGTNGFKIDGESTGAGSLISTLPGDINGDGYADILIGASGYSPAGRTYVIFGGSDIGSNGLILLSSLNGTTGFIMDGEVAGDGSGAGLSAAGDVNGDGVTDFLIGASGHNGGAGRSYVVFGDVPPVLINNKLNVVAGSSVILSYINLAAYDRNHNNQTLIFAPTGIAHGYFSTTSAPSIPLVNFTQQQITNGVIQFVHDGTQNPPRYNMSVYSTGIAWTGPWPVQIAFNLAQSYFPAILPLASLDGIIGFKLDGEANGDECSYPIAGVGDVNGDGYADILVGAPYYNSKTGRIYLIFGGAEIISGGVLSLSNLNGTNGFKLDGESTSDYNVGFDGDFWIKGGDVNGDVYSDLLIGALGFNGGTGRSYVIFGHPGIGVGGLLSLSSLNGTNGFKIDGEGVNDYSGNSLCKVGDVNGDSYTDLLIGAYRYNNYAGRSYVMLGSANGFVSTGSFSLSNLNGANGFKLDGGISENVGFSVNQVGDINKDGYDDLFIGAPAYGSTVQTGSYVVWGGPFVEKSVQSNLIALNGTNGFKCVGEMVGDVNGWSVSGGGDINADGYPDLLIGAWGYNNNIGRTYVIFGSSFLGIEGGILNISNLNVTTGLKLDGETSNDVSGAVVSMMGDVNGDGYGDFIIGAPWALNYAGRSYIVLGGSNGGAYNLSDLNGISGFKIDGETTGDVSGYSVSGAGDINGDGVNDFLVGARGGGPSHAGRGYVIFGDIPPILAQNHLSLRSGDTIQMNQTHLSAYDRNNNNNTITFIPSNITHGYFELISQPGVAITNFTQPQLLNGSVQFVHDGSVFAPSYNLTVYSAGIAWTGPSAANITFVPATTPTVTTSSTIAPSTSTPRMTTGTPTFTPTSTSTPTPIPTPVLINNQLTISNGQTVMLSSANLQAAETGFNVGNLIFYVSNVLNGYFSATPSSNSVAKNLTSFTQAQIQNGAIEFISAGNSQAPSYLVIVSDGMQTTSPSAAMVSFIGAPTITQNTLNITKGATITLTPALLNVTAPSGIAPGQVSLSVNDLQHATITSTLTHAPVSNFTLADVEAGDIQLTQDGSLITPSYTITATVIPTTLSSAPDPTNVLFSNQGVYAPQLVNNYLVITQGKATTLSNRYLSAQEPPMGQPLGNNAMFYLSNIEYGHFSLVDQPQIWITSFNQQQLLEGQVQFVQDGSPAAPGYKAAVLAFGLQSASLPASIFFTPANVSAPVLEGNSGYTTIQKAIIGAVISGTMGILFAVLQACLKRAANRKLLQALGDSTEQYDLTVVRPVAREIARQIKVTGCMNHTTNTKMAHFKSAVRTILFELDKRGVNLNFAEMKSPTRDGLINEIARQTRRIVLGDPGCCQGFVSFFKAQATPKAIEEAAVEIAAAVAAAVQTIPTAVRSESASVGMVELPSLSDSKDVLLMANRSSSQVVPPDSLVRGDAREEQPVANQVLGA